MKVSQPQSPPPNENPRTATEPGLFGMALKNLGFLGF